MIYSFLFVPFDTNLNLLRKKNHFSIPFHFMFLISWTMIIDVISITDVFILLLHCEPENMSKKHLFHSSHSSLHSLLSFRFFMKTFMMCLSSHSCYILSDNFLTFINFMIELPNIYFIIPIWIPSFLVIYDVYVNPGSNNIYNKNFSFCNWNCNSITKDDFNRAGLLKVQSSIYNYDRISVRETLLNNEVEIPSPLIEGYNFHVS